MSPIEVEIMRRKLAIIAENLATLKPIETMTEAEYIKDVYKRKATERLLQELIEAAIDINSHLIVQSSKATPDDYYESFINVGELGIISSNLAEKLAPSAGLGNRLVHEYDLLDHSLVLESVKVAEELYPCYIKEIEEYVSGKT